MNRIIKCLVFPLLFASCVQSKGDVAVVSGKWERGAINTIRLYKVVNGNLEEAASSALTADSMFYFACKPEREGFYFIGVNPQPSHRYPIYLKGGDRVNLTVTADSYRLNGNNSPENKELEKWHDFIQPVEWKAVYFLKASSTYRDFFPLLNEKSAALATYPPSRTGNKTFDRKFETYKQIDFPFLALAYMFAPRTEHPKAEDFPDYYRNMELSDFVQTAALMDYPGGLNLIDRMIYVKGMSTGTLTGDPTKVILENMDAMITNDTLKGELVMKFATSRRTYPGLLDYQDLYGKYLITEKQQNQFKNMLNALSDVKDNAPAVDFRFGDINGKPVSLSDFKGKVVYIDVWATWCGPCIKEIPSLKQLEDEYRNHPDVVFLSVSTDAQKDYEKWKKFVADQKLQGVQLFAGDKASQGIMSPYKISSIPRFILIGKNGNVASMDAPRPSSAEIRPALKALLK